MVFERSIVVLLSCIFTVLFLIKVQVFSLLEYKHERFPNCTYTYFNYNWTDWLPFKAKTTQTRVWSKLYRIMHFRETNKLWQVSIQKYIRLQISFIDPLWANQFPIVFDEFFFFDVDLGMYELIISLQFQHERVTASCSRRVFRLNTKLPVVRIIHFDRRYITMIKNHINKYFWDLFLI